MPEAIIKSHQALTSMRFLIKLKHQGNSTMNTIIYIVGLVVIIGIVLSYFGFR